MGNLRQHVHRKRKERERKRSRKNSKRGLKKEDKRDAVKTIEKTLRKSLVISAAQVLGGIQASTSEAREGSDRGNSSFHAAKPKDADGLESSCDAHPRKKGKKATKKRKSSNKEPSVSFKAAMKKDETSRAKVKLLGKKKRRKMLKRVVEEGEKFESDKPSDNFEIDDEPTGPLRGSLATGMGDLVLQTPETTENEEAADMDSFPSMSFVGGPANKALQKMRVAQFRMINEMLYTSRSDSAEQLFLEDRKNFDVYHEGYRQQVGKWLMNPLDRIISQIEENYAPKTRIADLGCGEARLAAVLKPHGFQVNSFDLVAANGHVQACNIKNVPLGPESVDVAVMCLSLMGTDMGQFVLEANRILVSSGHLLVAEVESRIPSVDAFVKIMKRYGFALESKDTARVFHFFDFRKAKAMPKGAEKNMDKVLWLKPCLYKKR